MVAYLKVLPPPEIICPEGDTPRAFVDEIFEMPDYHGKSMRYIGEWNTEKGIPEGFGVSMLCE